MTGDPADVGHTPVHIFRMNVLNVFRCPGYISKITASAVLSSLGLSGCAAGIHEEERRFSRHRNRINPYAIILLQQVVDKDVAAFHHRGLSRIFAGIALPYQDLFDLPTFCCRLCNGNISLFLVILNLPSPEIRIHSYQIVAS